MKILWVNQFVLHPTERGGQIRTLGILKELHKKHELHYAALDETDGGVAQSMAHTYSTKAYLIPHKAPPRRSLGFLFQFLRNIGCSQVPLTVARYASRRLLDVVTDLESKEVFDCVVCDFVASAVNMPNVSRAVVFQHNVETTIFERHALNATNPALRWVFSSQARRMRAYEGRVCREAAHVIAVSDIDAQRMRDMFGICNVSTVATGVDVGHFRRPPTHGPARSDLIFVGSMDWLPNIDAIIWFVDEILPIIRRKLPACTLTVVGRKPDQRIRDLARRDAGVVVTGTVPDVRPYLWDARVSVLPLRVGGGTRMKVYEAMAAGLPVVTTTVGVEGLAGVPGSDYVVADSPADFAATCISMLEDSVLRNRVGEGGYRLVDQHCSWEAVSRQFEQLLIEATSTRQHRHHNE